MMRLLKLIPFVLGLGACQPQPQAAVLARCGGVGLAEALEHVVEELGRDAHAGVGHDEGHGVVFVVYNQHLQAG